MLIEELEKDKEIIKSAFDNDSIDYDEYIEQIRVVNENIEEIKNPKQSYVDAIIKNKEDKILFLRRAIIDTFCPDCWSLPGGKIDKGEDPETAIIREVKEETNLNVIVNTLLLKKKIKSGFIYYFICEVDNLQDIILDNEEHISFEFCDQEKWQSLDLILDLKNTLLGLDVTKDDFDLFPPVQIYSNIEEEVANIQPKDIFMLKLFASDDIKVDDYVDYIEKAYKDANHKEKLTKIEGTDRGGKQITKWVNKTDLKKLANHAKNSSQKNLELAIKESDHTKIREAAHTELKRREKEEKTTEEKIGYESHEYHGKDFKFDSKAGVHLDLEGNKADPTKLYQYYDQRNKDKTDQLQKLQSDLNKETKQKNALNNKLIKNFYNHIKKTKFDMTDKEKVYDSSLGKLKKMGLSESDIDLEKLNKIIDNKKNKK